MGGIDLDFSIRRKLYAHLLESKNPVERMRAAEKLGEKPHPKSRIKLIVALNDEDPFVRRAAALSLGKYKKQPPIQPLLLLFLDPCEEVQVSAQMALADLDPFRFACKTLREIVQSLDEIEKRLFIKKLIGALEPDLTTKGKTANIIHLLGDIGDPSAVEPLLYFLKRISIQAELEQTKSRENICLFLKTSRMATYRMITAAITQNFSKLPIDFLEFIKIISHETCVLYRLTLLDLMAQRIISQGFMTEQVANFLLDCLNDKNPEIQDHIIWILGKLRLQEAIGPIVACIDPRNNKRIQQIRFALIEIDPARFGDLLQKEWNQLFLRLTFGEKNQYINALIDRIQKTQRTQERNNAVTLLKLIPDPLLISRIWTALGNDSTADFQLRINAIQILKAWKLKESVGFLLFQMLTADWVIEEEILAALAAIDRRYEGSKRQLCKRLNKEERDLIRRYLLENPTIMLSNSAQLMIAYIPDLRNENWLIELTRSTNINISSAAIETLGEIRSFAAVPILINLLKSSDFVNVGFKRKLIQSLGLIGHFEALDALIEFLIYGDYYYEIISDSLERFDIECIKDRLRYYSTSPRWEIRNGVAFIIGNLKLWDLTSILEQLTRDTIFSVVKMAIFALGQVQNPKAIECLKQLSIIDNDMIRLSALNSLAKQWENDTSGIEEIMKIHLYDPLEKIRVSAALILGLHGCIDSLPFLREIILNQDSIYRISALDVISHIFCEESVILLLSVLDSTPVFRGKIVDAVNQFLATIPSRVLPILHRFYLNIRSYIPDCFHLFHILPSLTGRSLMQIPSLEIGALINYWIQTQDPVALQLLQAFGAEIEPYIERIEANLKADSPQFNQLEQLKMDIFANNTIPINELYAIIL